MARLPVPGSDANTWGDILNDYLAVAHNTDGSLKNNAVGTGQVADAAVTEAKLSSAVQTKLNATPTVADGAITDVKVSATAAIAQSKIANLTTDLAAKANASDLTAKANAADVVAKADYFILPEDQAYGAVGNGVADDTAAIQAVFAASAAQGRTALLRKQYRITASLNSAAGMSIHLDKGAQLIKEFSGAGVANAFIRNASGNAGVKTNKIRITGPGKMGARNLTYTGQIIGLNGDDIVLDGFTIDTYAGGQAILIAGDRIRINGVQIINSAATSGTGAIRMVGGNDFVATNCHAESGDDVYQFVPIASATSPLFDLSINRGAYIGCTGMSTTARFLIAGQIDPAGSGNMTATVKDVSFIGCHGRANERGIYVVNDDSSGVLQNVNVTDCSVNMTGGQSGYQSIYIRRDTTNFAGVGAVDNVRFTGVRVANTVGLNFGFEGLPTNIVFEGCDFGKPSDGTTNYAAHGGDVDGLTVRNCIFRGAGASQYFFLGNNTIPAKNVVIDSCRFYDSSLTTGAVNMEAVTFGRVNNCVFHEAAGVSTARAVRVGSSSSRVYITSNEMSALTTNAKITNLATDTVIRDNYGFNTDNSGTATIAAAFTTVTVVHGLLNNGRTPTEKNISVTPTTSLGSATRFWISGVTSTNFVINTDVAPGGAGASFAWRIDTGRL